MPFLHKSVNLNSLNKIWEYFLMYQEKHLIWSTPNMCTFYSKTDFLNRNFRDELIIFTLLMEAHAQKFTTTFNSSLLIFSFNSTYVAVIVFHLTCLPSGGTPLIHLSGWSPPDHSEWRTRNPAPHYPALQSSLASRSQQIPSPHTTHAGLAASCWQMPAGKK